MVGGFCLGVCLGGLYGLCGCGGWVGLGLGRLSGSELVLLLGGGCLLLVDELFVCCSLVLLVLFVLVYFVGLLLLVL